MQCTHKHKCELIVMIQYKTMGRTEYVCTRYSYLVKSSETGIHQ